MKPQRRSREVLEVSSSEEDTTTNTIEIPVDILKENNGFFNLQGVRLDDDDESVGSLDDGKMNRKRSKGSNNPNSPDVSVGMSSTVLPDVMTLSTSLDINTDGKKKQTESEFIEEVRKNQRRTTINLGKSHSEDIWAKNHGFKEFFESGKFSDLALECHGRTFEVHKLILAFSSEYFAKELKDAKIGNRMKLDFPDVDNCMSVVIKYMYTGEIEITAENAVPLLAVADKLVMRNLKKELSAFITKNVRRENAVTLLKKALQFHADKIVKRCVHVVASNFAYLYDVSYEFLPYDLFVELICHKYLNVLREYELFQHIKRYLDHHIELSEEEKTRLLSCVRYRWFSMDQLIQVMQEGQVPKELLLEATFARLEHYEEKDKDKEGKEAQEIPERLQRRPLYPVVIKYNVLEKGIPPGIIDWIGRNAGRCEWTNPHVSGNVIVSTSSLCKGVLKDLVNTQENELWSADVPASWFCIDFGKNRTVIPSEYVLRHGGNYRADSLRNWDFQGSIDGVKWVVIRTHRHDSSLQGPFSIGHWEIEQKGGDEESNHGYRFFRVIQTGHNSSSRNFLVLSNVEIYGKLFERAKETP